MSISRNQRNSRWYVSSSQKARSLRTEYRLISRLALSKRSGGIDARPSPSAAYISSNSGDSSSNAASANRLMVRNGWSAGTRASGSTNANMLACFFARPRTAATSVVGATTVPSQPVLPEDPARPSQQPARSLALHGGPAVVDRQDDAADIAGRVGREEDDRR